MQRAVQPRNVRIDARRHIRRQVAARRANPDNPAAGRKAVRPGNVVRQHAGRRNRQQRALVHIAAVHMRRRNVVDDVDQIVPVAVLPMGVGHRVAEAVLVLLGLRRRCRLSGVVSNGEVSV